LIHRNPRCPTQTTPIKSAMTGRVSAKTSIVDLPLAGSQWS